LPCFERGEAAFCGTAHNKFQRMNLSLDKLPVNFFDVALLVVAATGLFQGRKHGMSGELLRLFQWLAVLFGCAFAYAPVGEFLTRSSDLFPPLTAYLTAYMGIAGLILVLFLGVKRTFGERLVGSDIFGQTEYYLGMGSGIVRALCILLAGLALLNARSYSTAEATAMVKFQNEVYGSNFFPTLQTVQSSVFERSLAGPYIKQYLSFLLIKPTRPQAPAQAWKPQDVVTQ
jgi:uncharacterized membrane protein required for colicin V production